MVTGACPTYALVDIVVDVKIVAVGDAAAAAAANTVRQPSPRFVTPRTLTMVWCLRQRRKGKTTTTDDARPTLDARILGLPEPRRPVCLDGTLNEKMKNNAGCI